MLVLDSGAVSGLAARTSRTAARIGRLRSIGLWPPVVPTPVLIEVLQGHDARDAAINRFLKTCDLDPEVPESLARRAAELRTLAGRGSAVDALVVACAEPGGVVLTGDRGDLAALATHARGVLVTTL